MAKAQTPAEQGGSAAPPAGKKKKLLIIMLAAVLLVVLAAGGAALLLLGGKPAGEHAQEQVEEVDEAAPIYERLETFTVNLADQASYLQVDISLKLADDKVQERLKQRMPEVRDVLLRLLSSKTAEELITPEGKAELAKDVRQEVNSVIGAKKAEQGVKDVLFTSFIIQ